MHHNIRRSKFFIVNQTLRLSATSWILILYTWIHVTNNFFASGSINQSFWQIDFFMHHTLVKPFLPQCVFSKIQQFYHVAYLTWRRKEITLRRYKVTQDKDKNWMSIWAIRRMQAILCLLWRLWFRTLSRRFLWSTVEVGLYRGLRNRSGCVQILLLRKTHFKV